MTSCFETECIRTLQGHPSSLILAPIESVYVTWSSLSCAVDIRAFVRRFAESQFFYISQPYSGQNFGCSIWIGSVICWGLQRANTLG